MDQKSVIYWAHMAMQKRTVKYSCGSLNMENKRGGDRLKNDMDLQSEELMKIMGFREEWKKLENDVQAH